MILRQSVAAFGTPQMAALVATPDEEISDLWIGIAVTGLLTRTARAWADHDAIGKFLGVALSLIASPSSARISGGICSRSSITAACSAGLSASVKSASQCPQTRAFWTRYGRSSSSASLAPLLGQIIENASLCHLQAATKAERVGFEPTVQFDPNTAFPVPHLRPLGHLSTPPDPRSRTMRHFANASSTVRKLDAGKVSSHWQHSRMVHPGLTTWQSAW